MKQILYTLIIIANAFTVNAQVNVSWTQNTAGVSIAADSQGSVYTVYYDYTQAGDITLTKRNSTGQLQWNASFNQTDPTLWEKAVWVETDKSGNAVVAGTLMSGYSNPVAAASIVMKFSSDGSLLWRRVFESLFEGSQTKKLLIDDQNNIYILGTGINGSNGLNLKVKKLSPDGSDLWNYYNAIGMPVNFKFTPDNALLVVGRSVTGTINGFAKLDRNGNPLWTLPGINSLMAGDAAGDDSGNTYIVNLENVFNPVRSVLKKIGLSGTEIWSSFHTIAAQRIEVGTDNLPVICGYPNPNSFGSSFAKFNAVGSLIWANPDADSTFSLMLHAQIKMDNLNNIYLAAGTMTQMAVCKVNNNGSSAWTVAIPGSYANGIDIGNDLSVYVVGGNTSKITQPGFSSVNESGNIIPKTFWLGRNYPNPFNPVTKISFGMQKSGLAEIVLFDIRGRKVRSLLNRQMNAGVHEIEFNAEGLPSGVYFYRFISGKYSETHKMILNK